jgi:hypothetical protein
MSFRSCLYAVTVFAACSAMGQVLDLSGVWLQEKSAYPDQELADPAPIVMEIHQTPTEMLLMSHQNGAQLSFHFDLSGQPTTREPGGYNPRLDRAKIKGGKLLVDSLVPPKAKDSPYGFQAKLTEIWELSPDARVLTIHRTVPGANCEVDRETETYQRQSSLDSALQLSEINSEMNRCVTEPGDPFAVEMARSPGFKRLANQNPKPTAPPVRNKQVLNSDTHYVRLGGANLHQLETCTAFSAYFFGDFFKGLERTPLPEGYAFVRNGQPVTTYPDDIVLDVEPKIWNCPGWWVTTPSPSPIPNALQLFPLPSEIRDLRFELVWKGSQRRELGEVPAELKTEPFTELGPAEQFFRMQISSKDVPLTDSVEIHVVSKAGKQLACIQGHL